MGGYAALGRNGTCDGQMECGASLKNKISSVELNGRLGVEDVVRWGRLRWFGHLE